MIRMCKREREFSCRQCLANQIIGNWPGSGKAWLVRSTVKRRRNEKGKPHVYKSNWSFFHRSDLLQLVCAEAERMDARGLVQIKRRFLVHDGLLSLLRGTPVGKGSLCLVWAREAWWREDGIQIYTHWWVWAVTKEARHRRSSIGIIGNEASLEMGKMHDPHACLKDAWARFPQAMHLHPCHNGAAAWLPSPCAPRLLLAILALECPPHCLMREICLQIRFSRVAVLRTWAWALIAFYHWKVLIKVIVGSNWYSQDCIKSIEQSYKDRSIDRFNSRVPAKLQTGYRLLLNQGSA